MNMVYEEYDFFEIKDYLNDNIDLLITGLPNEEERSHFLFDEWQKKRKDILVLKLEDNGYVFCRYHKGGTVDVSKIKLLTELAPFLKSIHISSMNVLMDLSGLSHVLFMFLTKKFLKELSPNLLFAAYIRPLKYLNESDDDENQLSQSFGEVNAVPGFAKREQGVPALCAFLGFEGIRLKSVLEAITVNRLVPIVAFPSGKPHWFNITMLNNMDIIQSGSKNLVVNKCYSESVFEAVDLLEKTFEDAEKVVLAPLGTRPHSLACAIYACRNKNVRLMYDFPVESKHRAIGVATITIYHLTSFIEY